MTSRAGTAQRPLRVAIVGAGPAGFYAAEALLKQDELVCSIDIFNRLPTPYGLVRQGVAPDHESIKRVSRVFDGIAERDEVRFFGHVAFGEDLHRNELLELYDQVVYATGAQTDRRLGIPGEEMPGSYAATEFVGWYNGHPDYADRRFDLDVERAVVVGNGNVAVDVARMLVTDPEELAATDIADHALATLRRSRVREVVMLGRRGPAQAKFTPVELKELGRREGVEVHVDPADLELDPASATVLERDRGVRRNCELLQEFAERDRDGRRRLELRFFTSPVALEGEADRVERVIVERNRLVPGAGGRLRAHGTGETEVIAAGLVLRSVGYRGVPLPEVPFDEARGVIPNREGRVTRGPGGPPAPREYVVGWIKRGPTGVIGTNKADAAETVRAMVEDVGDLRPADRPGPEAIVALLGERKPEHVTWEDWRRLDAVERARGEACGRPRVKVTSVAEMLRIVREARQAQQQATQEPTGTREAG